MNGIKFGAKRRTDGTGRVLLLLALLCLALAVLFHRSFVPNQILFSNDGPLGICKAECINGENNFFGAWYNLNWLGGAGMGATPNVSTLLWVMFPAEIMLKMYAPLTLLLLGMSAWIFFRQSGFGPLVCVLGGLAAGLNMHFFSPACWGLGAWNVSCAWTFLALALLVTPAIRNAWGKAALAGLAVGNVVMEGADVGVILSVYVGVFAFFLVLIEDSTPKKKLLKTIWMPALVVLFAMWVAVSFVSGMIGTQISGIVGTGQNQQEKAQRWNFATQWSLPKLEAFRLIIPGVFGYRLEQYIHGEDKSSAYWGRVGEDPNIPLIDSVDPEVRRAVAKALGLPPQYENALAGSDPQPRNQVAEALKGQLQRRHTGSGEYVGILVAVLALFGLANALRSSKTPFSIRERRMVFFWGVVALVSLLLAFGRHGFLYQLFYQLPYVSTIRNPVKFLFPFHIALMILAGYGLEVLHRCYLQNTSTRRASLPQHLRLWWAKAMGFDKKWTVGSVLTVGAAMLAALVLSSSKTELLGYLQRQGFSPTLAPQVADFFYGEILWFIVYLAASLGVIICILSGAWNGARAKWAWIFLGTILVLDLSRSDWRWIEYYDFNKRYISNPVIDFLRDKPYEHRVTAELMPLTRQAMTKEPNFFAAYYDMLQNQMPYWNIQSLDIVQAPRMPEFDNNYIMAFRPKNDIFPCLRLWQLTNTRYVLGSPDNSVGLKFDPQLGFEPRIRFNVTAKPWLAQALLPEDLTYVESQNGTLGLYELTNVLPRAKLYANWQSPTNDSATLEQLVSREFDPQRTVLVSKETPVAASPLLSEADPGTVTITSYHPKDVVLHATAKTPSVLLLNDKSAPDWKAFIDGKPAKVLRCNYTMRGVCLQPGEHEIKFHFQPKITTLYISLSAWAAGLLIAGFLFFSNRRRDVPSPNK